MQRTRQGRPRTQTPPAAIGMANEGVMWSRIPGQGHGSSPEGWTGIW
jgi:hypothetical protein